MEPTDTDAPPEQAEPMDVWYPHTKSAEPAKRLFVDMPWETPYTFKFIGDLQQKDNFLSAFRMYISRARSKARRQRRTIPDFKLVTVDSKLCAGNLSYEVTIMRQRTDVQRAASELPEIDDVTASMLEG